MIPNELDQAIEAVRDGVPAEFVAQMIREGLTAHYYIDYDDYDDTLAKPAPRPVLEVAPPGMKMMVKAMKRAKGRGDIGKNSNVFALAWSMKNRGYHSHHD